VLGFEGFTSRAQARMKGFRAFTLSREQLREKVQQRLKQPLEKSEVWYVWLV
jgi:hypothetical protein